MTFIAHAALGGMIYALPPRALGAPAEVCGALWMLGAQLGALPDALPWMVERITGRGDLEQWLRNILHDPPPAGCHWMKLLVVPWIHVSCDRLVHSPSLPDPGTSPFHDRVLIRIRSWKLTVRDIFWCAGEAVLWLVTYTFVELYLAL
jgi:hypothetical protein